MRSAGLKVLHLPYFFRLAIGLALAHGLAPTITLAGAAASQDPVYYHLRQGVTLYVANPNGQPFGLAIDLKDLNVFCQGAQTALFKVYDPDGNVLHEEDIPDDGITDGGYAQAWAGWDHELWARGAIRELGAEPLFRWDTFSSPRKLDKIRGAARKVAVSPGKKGVYQIQLVGCDDHFVKLQLSPALSFGVLGHPDFFAGHADQFREAYLYVPELPYYARKQNRIDLCVIEHGYPRTRQLTLYHGSRQLPMKRIPQGDTVGTLTPGQALGRATVSLEGVEPGTVLKLVNEGQQDYLLRIHGIPPILCPDAATARLIHGGMERLLGGPVVSFPFQKELWNAVKHLKKGDFDIGLKPGEWFQTTSDEVRRIMVHPWECTRNPKNVDGILVKVQKLLDTSDPFDLVTFYGALSLGSSEVKDLALFCRYPFKGNRMYGNRAVRNLVTLALIKAWMKFRGGEVVFEWGELNVAYAQGFHWNWWEPIWYMREALDPAVLRAFQKGVKRIADRMAFANGLELVISNGRTTVPLNLYHAYLITDETRLKARALDYLRRMRTARDGPHSGWSETGYFREHFGPDGGYCTYPLYQLGRMYQISKEKDVLDILDRLCRWMCYVTFPTGGRWTGPTSWNSRIAAAPIEHIWGSGYVYCAAESEWAARLYRHFHTNPAVYDLPDPAFEPGKPIPKKPTLLQTHLTRRVIPARPFPAESAEPFFTDVGGGGELFAVRRGSYYALVYAGRRIPFWMDISLDGVMDFSGGGLTGLYVPGVGPVLMGRHNKQYGWPIEKWEQLSVPVVAGETSDGRFFNTGVCRNEVHPDKKNWSIRTVGEAVTVPVNFERTCRFDEKGIAASVAIRNAELNADVFQYRSHFRKPHRGIKYAWELVPFVTGKDTRVTALDAAGKALGDLTEAGFEGVKTIEIDVGKGGARLVLEDVRTVRLSKKCNRWARSIQIKVCDTVRYGESAGVAYTITPFVR